ncbi:hypothetical protein Hypma_015579 [Hypsizygus marmoreus]|uniref:Uncharacterized protein n=1 Tax=Hypsizygus marmoreus TaxID=39966 RepID=A0A369K387_HYPMA|nr:hypothetical protein Hypma_015579 [Hypsizygus marmoreus]
MLFATSSLQDSSSRFFIVCSFFYCSLTFSYQSGLREGNERCASLSSMTAGFVVERFFLPCHLQVRVGQFVDPKRSLTLSILHSTALCSVSRQAHVTPQRERHITKSLTRARDSFYGFGGSKRLTQAMRLCHILGTSSKNPFATFVKGRDPCENTPLSIESDDSHKQTANATRPRSLTTVPTTSTTYISHSYGCCPLAPQP